MSKLLFEGSEWTVDTIERIADECNKIAVEELNLDCYPNQFEIITSSQMLDAYASIGMPVYYNHWSFGKSFVMEEQSYRSGKSGLAYELVINSNPCINYLMEENSATIQTLVIAHAGSGHNHFFKNNYLFKEWTNADSIIDYLVFAKKYIKSCEERYGVDAVERILDAAHALQNIGVDKYKKPEPLTAQAELERQQARTEYEQASFDVVWSSWAKKHSKTELMHKVFPEHPEENVLKFIEKNSPSLEAWQRELIRIIRMIAQYFRPQRQTKVMNEGFACWVHCYIMNRLYEKGLISEGSMLEFMHVHSNVVFQPDYTRMASFNPYALGLEIFRDIERICKEPTDEDKEWFPEIVGRDYKEVILDAVANYRDESFIRQFLSPKLIRDMRMFRLGDEDEDFYLVTDIHNDAGYKAIRNSLADQYDISKHDPDIQVTNSNLATNRVLELTHASIGGKLLEEDDAYRCMSLLRRLWGFDILIYSLDDQFDLVDEYSTII